MNTSLDQLGKWPLSGEEARRNNRLVCIPPDKSLNVIHGKKNHILISFFVSNDYLHFGILQIPQGTYSDPEEHKGDEVIFVIKGKLTVQTYEKGYDDKSLLHSTYDIAKEEQFLIPEGVRHRYLNFSKGVVKAVFGIAPAL